MGELKKYSDLTLKQLDCIEFITEDDLTLVLADVGTGKTVMSLTAVKHWLENDEVDRVLVVGPLRVARDVWQQEKEEWTHLKDCPFRIDIAADITEAKRRKILEGDAEVVTINYESLPWLFENYPDLRELGFDALVCDEIDKLKDRTSNRFKGYKKKIGKRKTVKIPGLRKVRGQFIKILGLTGTPTPKNLLDLWAIAFIVDGGASLGGSYDQFKRKNFYPTDYMQFDWQILPGREKMIYDALADITYRIERDDEIPGLRVVDRWVTLPPKVIQQYKRFERDLILTIEQTETLNRELREAKNEAAAIADDDSIDHSILETAAEVIEDLSRKVEIEAANAAVLHGKLRQMVGGFLYTDKPGETTKGPRPAERLHSVKLADLDDLIGELQGQQLIVVYYYQHELIMLQERYPDIRDSKDAGAVDAWNRGDLQLMALHPKSAGHGLNMQKSHAQHMYFYTLPDTAGLWEQVTGRLRRTGNDSDTIFAHRALAKETLDIERLEVIEKEIKDSAEFLEAIAQRQKERT